MAREAALTIRLNPADNVVVARADILPGTAIPGESVATRGLVPSGHKLATEAVGKGEPIRKYNQIIGFATAAIRPGEHVHTQNCAFQIFERAYEHGVDAKPTRYLTGAGQAQFQGFKRRDGTVGTRNYLGILSSVNCSAHVSKVLAAKAEQSLLKDFPNVDGVVALTHGTGCGMAASGLGMDVLRRTIAGYARHPNFAGILMIGLGCEVNQIGGILASEELEPGPLLHPMTIQDSGGSAATVKAGLERIKAMLPEANRAKREPAPASHITIGLQCGGSDGYSGISANPALGSASDLLVRHGGTVLLSETPETYGAEHMLVRRAVNREVGQKLVDLIRWWLAYTEKHGGSMDNNPSPGNKAGGLTTILEKALGASAKGGTTNLADVIHYAEPARTKGFLFMDSPGYDPVSATGQVASGANMICFTTGRGSVFGCKPAPSIKLATNTPLYQRMGDDMDINCGTIIDGAESVQQCGERIFELILKVASGQKTKSEEFGFGEDEFQPWQLGAVM
jgi:altronate hydrolase